MHALRGWQVPCDYWRNSGISVSVMRDRNLLSISWSLCLLPLWCWIFKEFRHGGLYMHPLRHRQILHRGSVGVHALRGWQVPFGYWRNSGISVSVMRSGGIFSFSGRLSLRHLSRWIEYRCQHWVYQLLTLS